MCHKIRSNEKSEKFCKIRWLFDSLDNEIYLCNMQAPDAKDCFNDWQSSFYKCWIY